MNNKWKKYVVCGHYGVTNLGDEAIGLGLIQTIKTANPKHEVVILSYDKVQSEDFYNKYVPEFKIRTAYLIPFGIRSIFRGVFKGELNKTKKEIRSCDRFVLGGGGLFTDERLYAVFLWGLQGFFAIRYGKPLYLVGHSVGPLNTRIGRWIVKKIFNKAQFISVRDSESKKTLLDIGVKKEIHVLCDMAMLVDFDLKMPAEKVNKKVVQASSEKYFILTFRDWDKKLKKLNKKIIQTVSRIVQDCNLKPVLIPFQLIKENDQEVLNKKIVQKGDLRKIVVQEYQDDFFAILHQIKSAEFVIGTRLHSLIFSSLAGVPFVGISYSEKVENFMSELGLEDYCLKNNEFENDSLQDKITKMIENSENIRRILNEKVLKMKKHAEARLIKVLK